jgi:hypothetical protein
MVGKLMRVLIALKLPQAILFHDSKKRHRWRTSSAIGIYEIG